MSTQHQSAAEFRKLFNIAWRRPSAWDQAARTGLNAVQAAGLRDMCDAYGEDYATEEAELMAHIRSRCTEHDDREFGGFDVKGIDASLAAVGSTAGLGCKTVTS